MKVKKTKLKQDKRIPKKFKKNIENQSNTKPKIKVNTIKSEVKKKRKRGEELLKKILIGM